MSGRFIHLRNVGSEPIDIVQDDAPGGIRRIEAGEAFNADEKTAMILTSVAPVIVEAEILATPSPRDRLIVPQSAGDLQAMIAEATR